MPPVVGSLAEVEHCLKSYSESVLALLHIYSPSETLILAKVNGRRVVEDVGVPSAVAVPFGRTTKPFMRRLSISTRARKVVGELLLQAILNS